MKLPSHILEIYKKPIFDYILLAILTSLALAVVVFSIIDHEQSKLVSLEADHAQNRASLLSTKYTDLKNEDPRKVNQALMAEISNINSTYKDAVSSYENLQDLKLQNSKLDKKYDAQLASILRQLADKDYSGAKTAITNLNKSLGDEKGKLAAATPVSPAATANLPTSNTPPSSGFSRQAVDTDGAKFTVDIVSADLNSTKVIVDTASDSDCKDNCPTLPLATYVSRTGAYAGINGSFFCPAEYPSCAGKTGSFDTLLMNKDKHYFNSDNNVYSVVPAAIFSAGSARFVGRSMDWGRDTGVDSVIANYPLYVTGGNVSFGGNGDSKIDNKGSRTFIAHKGNIVYIGIVYNASGSDAAKVLKALGMDNALGLDQGGSTALWSGGYKAGPGRNMPNAILFVKR